MYDYPTEYDGPSHCEVCGKNISHPSTECECPECPVCSEVGSLGCYGTHMPKPEDFPTIRDIQSLAAHIGACHDTEKSIARRLYKDTLCGVSAGIETDGTGFWVAGYCEGSDQEHEVYVVSFPCTEKQIDEAISQADKDGCDTWDETHACEMCYPEGNVDQWGNEFLPGRAGGPINPECSDCGGDGIVM